MNYIKHSKETILEKKGVLKLKWDLSLYVRRAVLWIKRRDSLYNASRAELRSIFKTTSVADGLSQHEKQLKYLK